VLNRGIEKRLIFRSGLSVMYRRDPQAPAVLLAAPSCRYAAAP